MQQRVDVSLCCRRVTLFDSEMIPKTVTSPMILHRTTSSDSHFQPQQNQATKTKHNKAIFHLEHSTILELLLTTREKKKKTWFILVPFPVTSVPKKMFKNWFGQDFGLAKPNP